MEANLQSDFQIMESFLNKLLEGIEALNKQDAREQLAQSLLRYYRSGGELEFRLIPARYSDEIVQSLTSANIPLMYSPNRNGDMTLILPSEKKGVYEWSHIIEDVLMRYPEYYKQVAPDTYARLALADEEQGLMKISFANEIEADLFKNKAFAEGMGIVTTDKKRADGTVDVYCRSSELYMNKGNRQDLLNALIDTELSSGNEPQNIIRRLAVLHDRKQVDECMRRFQGGMNFIIHNGEDKTSDYLEFKNGVLTPYVREQGMFVPKTSISFADFDIHSQEGLEQARHLFEYQLQHIKNEQVSTISEYENFCQKSEEQLSAEYSDRQRDLYRMGILPAIQAHSHKTYDKDGKAVYEIDTDALNDFLTDSDYLKELLNKNEAFKNIRPSSSADFLKGIRTSIENDRKIRDTELTMLQDKAGMSLEKRKEELYNIISQGTNQDIHLVRQHDISKWRDVFENQIIRTSRTKVRQALPKEALELLNDPEDFLRKAFKQYQKRPIYRQEEMQALLNKPSLTEEEHKILSDFAEDFLCKNLTAKTPEFIRNANTLIQGKEMVRQLDDYLQKQNDKNNQLTEAEQKHLQELTIEVGNLKAEEDILRTLLDTEESRQRTKNECSIDLHKHLQEFLENNPNSNISGILEESRNFMNRYKDEHHNYELFHDTHTDFLPIREAVSELVPPKTLEKDYELDNGVIKNAIERTY